MYGLYNEVGIFIVFCFLGYIMECLVIRKEKGVFENRGMAKGPFLPIYGFGVFILEPLFQPVLDNPFLIFIIGALTATFFEYVVGEIMLLSMGKLWWDYSDKFLNYKGIICFQSTIAWGVAAIVVMKFLLEEVNELVMQIPIEILHVVAVVFPIAYLIDLGFTMHRERMVQVDDRNAKTA